MRRCSTPRDDRARHAHQRGGRRLARQDRARPRRAARRARVRRVRAADPRRGRDPAAAGRLPVHELWKVLPARCRAASALEQVTVFDSVGFALEDYTALRYIHQLADRARRGAGRSRWCPSSTIRRTCSALTAVGPAARRAAACGMMGGCPARRPLLDPVPCSPSTTTGTHSIKAKSRCSAANSCRVSRCRPAPTTCRHETRAPRARPAASRPMRCAEALLARGACAALPRLHRAAPGTSGWRSIPPMPNARRRCPRTGRRAACAPTCCPRVFPRGMGLFGFDAGTPLTAGSWAGRAPRRAPSAFTAAQRVVGGERAAFALTPAAGPPCGRRFLRRLLFPQQRRRRRAGAARRGRRARGRARRRLPPRQRHAGRSSTSATTCISRACMAIRSPTIPTTSAMPTSAAPARGWASTTTCRCARGTDFTTWRAALTSALRRHRG